MLAAVHRDGLPGDVVRAGEKQHGVGDLFGRRAVSERHRGAATRECLIILPGVRQGGAWRDCIHAQVRRQGLGKRRGRHMKPALGQPIGEKSWRWPVYALVEHVHDRPARRRLRGENLRQKQRRTQVNREMAIEPVPIKVGDLIWLEFGGVVDEEGQRPDRRDGRGHDAEHASVIGEISRDDAGTPAIASDIVAQLRRGLERPVGVDCHRISGPSERQHDRAADTPGAAGDERGRRGCCGERRHLRLIAQMIGIGNPGFAVRLGF